MTYLHIDLCSGLGGWKAPFESSDNWRSVGVDIQPKAGADVVGDVNHLPIDAETPELVTASPPCTGFARWMLPWLDEPNPDMSLVHACLEAIEELNPSWWVLENSRGLHQYWKPANTHYGAYYLWGNFPPVDVVQSWKGKMQTSGTAPDQRAEIPYTLADALRKSVEWY